jgi:hypothetical protein
MTRQELQSTVGRAATAFAIALWLACAFGVRSARADGGEAGLVIQDGEVVTTYCVAFSGDGITGDQLLQKTGVSVGTGGAQSGRTVCSINQTGCFNVNPNDFNSCFCQCAGGPTCTYWAYFTRPYGKNWAYSSLAFNLVKAKDGDVQGWKWGAGGPSSAPAPKDVSFEQICGHAPQGGVAPTVALPPNNALASTSSPGATAPTGSITAPASSSTTATATATTPGQTATASPVPNVTLVPPGASATPGVPSVGASDDSAGGNGRQLLAFGVVVAGLTVAIIMALTWRRRRGL